MSALGHERTSRHVHVKSALPLKAGINQRGLHVFLVPLADSAAEQRSFHRWTRRGRKTMLLTPCKTQRLAQRGGISPLVLRLPQPLSRDLTWNRIVPKNEIARPQPLE